MNENTQDMQTLLSKKPSLEQIFTHPSYLDEVTYQSGQLFDFLC